jgi:N-acylneuraminate cytidylyltransferase
LNNDKLIPINYNPQKRLTRQHMDKQFIENGAIYITSYKSFAKSKCRISGKIGLYEMPEELSIDIDTKSDLIKAAQIMRKK